MEVINFVGLTVGELRLRKDLATRERLNDLFALDGNTVIIDQEGDEVDDISQLSHSQVYTVVAEEDLADDSPFQQDPSSFSLEERRNFFIKRQKRLEKMEKERRKLINEFYVPKYPEIFKFSMDFLHPELRKAMELNTLEIFLTKLTDSKIYTFPVLTEEFCNKLIEEVELFVFILK